MKRVETKLNNFSVALKRLREAVSAYKNERDNALYRDALIQRFEFTFELAWKTTSEVLREQGVVVEIISPKSVFRSAYNAGYIDNEEMWIKIIDDRNSMSHTYDEQTAQTVADAICNHYCKELALLLKNLSK